MIKRIIMKQTIIGFLWALLSGLSEPIGAGIGWAVISLSAFLSITAILEPKCNGCVDVSEM